MQRIHVKKKMLRSTRKNRKDDRKKKEITEVKITQKEESIESHKCTEKKTINERTNFPHCCRITLPAVGGAFLSSKSMTSGNKLLKPLSVHEEFWHKRT
jgi:hypothetical protein